MKRWQRSLLIVLVIWVTLGTVSMFLNDIVPTTDTLYEINEAYQENATNQTLPNCEGESHWDCPYPLRLVLPIIGFMILVFITLSFVACIYQEKKNTDADAYNDESDKQA